MLDDYELYAKRLIDIFEIRKEKVVIYPMNKNGIKLKFYLNSMFNVNEIMMLDRYWGTFDSTQVTVVEDLEKLNNVNEYIYILTIDNGYNGMLYDNLIKYNVFPGNIINIRDDKKQSAANFMWWHLKSNPNIQSWYDKDGFFEQQHYISKGIYSSLTSKVEQINNMHIYTPIQKKYAVLDTIYDEKKLDHYDILTAFIENKKTAFEIINAYKLIVNEMIFFDINNTTFNEEIKDFKYTKMIFGTMIIHIIKRWGK